MAPRKDRPALSHAPIPPNPPRPCGSRRASSPPSREPAGRSDHFAAFNARITAVMVFACAPRPTRTITLFTSSSIVGADRFPGARLAVGVSPAARAWRFHDCGNDNGGQLLPCKPPTLRAPDDATRKVAAASAHAAALRRKRSRPPRSYRRQSLPFDPRFMLSTPRAGEDLDPPSAPV